jgi:hypothetical protein
MSKLEIVPGYVRDPERCQALVLSSGDFRQCAAKATSRRRPSLPTHVAADALAQHPCCERHRRARWFVLWNPLDALSGAERLDHTRRLLERLESPGGPRPATVGTPPPQSEGKK